mmetsp:Transcript_49324/g.86867  ORF Transcript_49324/g.86867 Transcript_49324/m.86867 type:complete len:257 (-) Transcript_49324:25-795(-)
MTISPQLGPAFPVVIPIGGPKNHMAEPGQEQMPSPGSANPATGEQGGSGGPVQGLAEAAMWKAMGDVVVARLTGQSPRAASTSMYQVRLKTSFAALDDGLPPCGAGLGMGAAPPPAFLGVPDGTFALTPASSYSPGAQMVVDGPQIARLWMGAEPPAGFTPIALAGYLSALPGGDGGVFMGAGGHVENVIGKFSNFVYYAGIVPPGSKSDAVLAGLTAAPHVTRPRSHSAPNGGCRRETKKRWARLRAHAVGSTFL